MAVSDQLFEAACRQSGIARVSNITEAGPVASAFINRPLPKGRRVGIVTGGGGLGVVASDLCTELGLEVATLSDQTLTKIGKMMPRWWVAGNPVDLVAGMNDKVVVPILKTLMQSGEIDALMILFIGLERDGTAPKRIDNEQTRQLEKRRELISKMFKHFVDYLAKMMNDLDLPIYMVANVEAAEQDASVRVMDQRPMTVFDSIETACAAIKAMADYSQFRNNAVKSKALAPAKSETEDHRDVGDRELPRTTDQEGHGNGTTAKRV
jgi:acyl-CoA synthetase (NDP forming)